MSGPVPGPLDDPEGAQDSCSAGGQKERAPDPASAVAVAPSGTGHIAAAGHLTLASLAAVANRRSSAPACIGHWVPLGTTFRPSYGRLLRSNVDRNLTS